MDASSEFLYLSRRVLLYIGYLVAVFWVSCAVSAPSTDVFSEASPDYQRKMLPSGRYEPETYAFGKGVCLDKLGKDKSLTVLSFHEICEILAGTLEKADYIATPGPEETDLVIVVSWGRTTPFDQGLYDHIADSMADTANEVTRLNGLKESLPEGGTGSGIAQLTQELGSIQRSLEGTYEGRMDQMLILKQMEDDRRFRSNRYNAKLLGFHDKLKWAAYLTRFSMVHKYLVFDLITEVENPRYFVILQAYDFQAMWKEKKKVMLWTTRFSIRAQRRKFDEELQDMALAACPTFGIDSKGLKRGLTRTDVKLGELEYLGVVEEE